MSLGQYKTVPVGLSRISGVDVHLFKIQHGQQLDDGKAAADVADAEMPDGFQGVAADVQTVLFERRIQESVLLGCYFAA